MEPALSHFIGFYTDLANLIQECFPSKYRRFANRRMNVVFKMQHLEIIVHRYNQSKKIFDEVIEIWNTKLKLYSTSVDPEIRKESQEFLKRQDFALKSLIVDIESFLIFANITLDNVIWMIKPFIKDNFTKNVPKTQSFGKYCDWTKKNQIDYKDQDYLSFILDLREWFQKNIREPRNTLVVHKYGYFIQDSFSFTGQIIRAKRYASATVREDPVAIFEFSSPVKLYEELYDYLKILENILIKKFKIICI